MHASRNTSVPTPDPLAIVCSLDAAGVTERLAEFEHLFASALVSLEREPARLRLVLSVSEQGESVVRDLFDREADCCRFFSFDVWRDGQTLVVTMGVPPGAEPVLDEFESRAARASRPAPR